MTARRRRSLTWTAVVTALAVLVVACGSSGGSTSTSSAPGSSAALGPTSATPGTAPPGTATAVPLPSMASAPSRLAPASSGAAGPTVPAGTGPVIVIDPGHSPSITHVDAATGLVDSDYENEPEMRDVYAVALLVKAALVAAGYRVVMTKTSVDDRVSLGERAAIANNAHAALAISIHDQAGADGGIGFTAGNNIVYYQSVGTYRETPAGKKIYFTNSSVAATSARYGAIFQAKRAAAQGATIRLQPNVGYDLGTRGLPAGNIWMVQLLSKVPWVYNEAGGNSAGMSGLDPSDKQKYANGLVAAIEQCVPVTS